MAVLRAFQPIDMPNDTVWLWNLIESSATRIDIRLGAQRVLYEGEFSYSLSGSVSGTLAKVTEWNSSGKYYELTEVNGDARAFYNAILQRDAQLAASIALDKDDTVFGSSGDDVIYSWAGNDIVRAEKGNDEIWSGSGSDKLIGSGGKDVLKGQKGNDKLLGGSGRDKLDGGSGNDKLNGGSGNDKLKGGKGVDDFIFKGSFGKDVITDFNALKGKEDINLSGVKQIKSFKDLSNNHMSQKDDDVLIEAGKNSILVKDTDVSDLDASDFIF